tara:strand:+ start:555 stop:737 length:183 start_codon:yes stop_codon:yes gene_type:complete
MIERYKQLFCELKLLEYQLKDQCKTRFGKEIAFKMLSRKKYFVSPESFVNILRGKDGSKK